MDRRCRNCLPSFPHERRQSLRSGGAPSELYPRGRGTRDDAGRRELPDQDPRGSGRRTAVHPPAAPGDANGEGTAACAGRDGGFRGFAERIRRRRGSGSDGFVDHHPLDLRIQLARSAPGTLPAASSQHCGSDFRFDRDGRIRAERVRHRNQERYGGMAGARDACPVSQSVHACLQPGAAPRCRVARAHRPSQTAAHLAERSVVAGLVRCGRGARRRSIPSPGQLARGAAVRGHGGHCGSGRGTHQPVLLPGRSGVRAARQALRPAGHHGSELLAGLSESAQAIRQDRGVPGLGAERGGGRQREGCAPQPKWKPGPEAPVSTRSLLGSLGFHRLRLEIDQHVEQGAVVEHDHALLVMQPFHRILDGLGIDELGLGQGPLGLDDAALARSGRRKHLDVALP